VLIYWKWILVLLSDSDWMPISPKDGGMKKYIGMADATFKGEVTVK
jgi:hypothetical protein